MTYDDMIVLPLIPLMVAAILDWPDRNMLPGLSLVACTIALTAAVIFNRG